MHYSKLTLWFNKQTKQVKYLLIGGGALTVWMLSGLISFKTEPMQTTSLPQVEVQHSTAVFKPKTLTLQGYTHPSKTAIIKAQTTSTVEAIHTAEGGFAQKGTLLLTLQKQERSATLRQAQANLKHKKAELKTAQKLSKEGFQSQNKVKEARADLKAAQAQLKTAKTAVAHTKIYAPFDGIFAKHHTDIGTTVQSGDTLITFLSIAPLHVIAAAPQDKVNSLQKNSQATVKFANNTTTAYVDYIAPQADAATRTYEVKATLPNPQKAYRAGKSVQVTFPLEKVYMHKLSPAFLSLSAEGVLGIKTLTKENVVKFSPITLEKTTPEGIWISGLDETATIITLGHHFVKNGQKVTPKANTTPTQKNNIIKSTQ